MFNLTGLRSQVFSVFVCENIAGYRQGNMRGNIQQVGQGKKKTEQENRNYKARKQ